MYKTLQIGFGKMGKYIYNVLRQSDQVSEICVCDIAFEKEYTEGNTCFVKSIDEMDLSDFDCAFIVSPATTHFDYLVRLLNAGIKNIYVEKPIVITESEYDIVDSMRKDAKIATGYILRQSSALEDALKFSKELFDEEFVVDFSAIRYQKPYSSIEAERAESDLGIFEELVHIYDLLFVFDTIGYGDVSFNLIDYHFERDPKNKDRFISANLNYECDFGYKKTFVQIMSSFKADYKKRVLFATGSNRNGELGHLYVSFDSEDGKDRAYLFSDDRGQIFFKESDSTDKLYIEIDKVFKYFDTGDPSNLEIFENDRENIGYMESLIRAAKNEVQ